MNITHLKSIFHNTGPFSPATSTFRSTHTCAHTHAHAHTHRQSGTGWALRATIDFSSVSNKPFHTRQGGAYKASNLA